jgi:hypothetical protein
MYQLEICAVICLRFALFLGDKRRNLFGSFA